MARYEINIQIRRHVPAEWADESTAFRQAREASGFSPRSFAQRWNWLQRSGFIETRVSFVAPAGSGLRNKVEVRRKPE